MRVTLVSGNHCLRIEPLKIRMMPPAGSASYFTSCRCNGMNIQGRQLSKGFLCPSGSYPGKN